MNICHTCFRGVMYDSDMSLYVSYRYIMLVCHGDISLRVSRMSCRYVMAICHGDISLGFSICHADMSWCYVMVIYHWGFRICHAGMSWGYVMNICHTCIRGVMYDSDMSLYISCRCIMLVCHGDISLRVSHM